MQQNSVAQRVVQWHRDIRNVLPVISRLISGTFVRAIRRFMEMKMLTKNLLTELIDRIEVHETEGVGKNRTQRVVIYYRFVGYLEIPDEQTRFSEDTRQGVSVEYISCAPIKVRYGDDGEEIEEVG